MSEGSREKAVGPALQGATPAAISKTSPGRTTLTGGMEEGTAGPFHQRSVFDAAGGGDDLPHQQRSQFESSVGRDLGGVRVHTNDAAAEQADQHGARAFAVGQDIMFAKGEYKPGTPEGDQLIAHEVAHTVQQGGAQKPTGELATTKPGDRAEKNADGAAAAMVEGKPADVSAEPVAIARKGKDEPVAPPTVPAAPSANVVAPGPDQGGDGKSAEGKPGEKVEAGGGDLSAERVGQEELEGTEPIGPPQNLEAGKAELASKAAALPADGGAGELKGVKVDGAGGAGGAGGGDAKLTEDMQLAISVAQADAKDGAAEAESEAAAYKAQMNAERDRFDAQQQALTLEKLKEMSPADKRSTIVEMGYDQKAVKKMKDGELDALISGKLDTEARKTRILGMDEKELAGLSADRKKQFLVDLGVDKGDLDKIGPQKAAAAFDDVMRVAHVPGQHNVKVKIKGGLLAKSWEIKVNVDAAGNPEFDVQKKGGFLSKLWGWVKAALPIIAVLLVPLTGGASLIALAVYQTVTAIAHGDWLGAIIGGAGAIVGLGALAGIKNGVGAAAKAFKQIADVADKVKGVANAAKAAMMAAKAKSPGGLMAALATGASSFADLAGKSAEKFATTMRNWGTRLDKWSKVVQGGEGVIAGIKNGDPAAAIGSAFDAAAAAVSKPEKKEDGTKVETSAKAKDFQRYSRIAGFASAGQHAVKSQPPDYGAVVDSAMGIAGELKDSKRLDEATKITSAASRLTRAIQTKDPGQLAAAALGLAEAIQTAKYNHDHPDTKDADGKTPDDDREKVTKRYAQATSIVKFASAALTAAATKPRPSYTGALTAATQLIADLTDNKKVDQAALLTSRLDAWTSAVQSKNEGAIIEAGKAFGEAINGMRDLIHQERDDAKKAAQAKAAPGEPISGDDGGTLPSVSFAGIGTLPAGLQPQPVDLDGDGVADYVPTAKVETTEEFKGVVPNYTVVPGDTFSGIASRFHTTVAVLRSANPTANPLRLQIGQRIFVPGADKQLTPVVTVDTSFDGPAGKDPLDNIKVPPGGNAPKPEDSGNKKFELTKDQQLIVDAIKVAALLLKEGLQHPGLAAGIHEWEAIAKAIETSTEKKDATGWEKAKADLAAVTATLELGKAMAKEWGSFKQYYDMLDESPAAKQRAKDGLRVVAKFQKNIGRLIRFGDIFVKFHSAADDLVVAAGYKADLSGAPADLKDRVAAAGRLVSEVKELGTDLEWAAQMARVLATKLGAGQAAEGFAIVARAANRYGASISEAVMKWAKPVLEEAATKFPGKTVVEVAGRVAGEIAGWGAALEGTAGKQVLSVVFKELVGKLGFVAKIGLSWEFAAAYEIAKAEAYLTGKLYEHVHDVFSQWLSVGVFGKNINALKSDIRGKADGDLEACNQVIDYVYYEMLRGAQPDVKQNWNMYIYEQGKRRFIFGGTFANQFSTAPYQALKSLGPLEVKKIAISNIKTLAVEFLDREFQRIFIDRA